MEAALRGARRGVWDTGRGHRAVVAGSVRRTQGRWPGDVPIPDSVVAAGTRHVPGGWDDVDTGVGRRNAVSTSTAREAPRGREQGGRVAAGPATSGMSEDPALMWHE
ncbi:hypothetical protein LY12_000689 [Prauserella alba]|uniref:Uncharacterized protein n=1 Tax=Prauserella alba TaxID=176898 RepID=A0ABN1VDN1_9PSEU|nr:hypothetical protein [Prauserella alba]